MTPNQPRWDHRRGPQFSNTLDHSATEPNVLPAASKAFLRAAMGLMVMLTLLSLGVQAQKTATPQDAQGSGTPQGPGVPGTSGDPGTPIVINEGETVATTTGAQTRVYSTILHRDPTDPEHATDPRTGRNFNWDPKQKAWVNSQTGKSAVFVGYLSSGETDPGTPVVINEGETVATVTGAQTRVYSTILHRDPTDPEHATDPRTGRNFNWDPDRKTWVDSQTGKSVTLVGYLAPTPAATATAPSTPQSAPPKENKTVSVSTPGQPAPPKPLVSMQVGGGLGFSNIGGTSGDRAAFLNSFPGGTFSTSANTFAGNVGSSIGIGPAVFDFNAWRANRSDSKGSGPVLGGGTDTAHITQQFQGISLTGGGKIPLGGGVSLILRGGGNFWHSNIDTKETVTGTTSNTATNSRGVDGIGWTTGAALQVDVSRRWSAVVRWDYLSMNNAGVNVRLNQGSVGMMFRLFGVPGK
jgi:hypothetical protein